MPYTLGVAIASGDDFDNHSGWLLVPVVGPWLLLATREDRCPRGGSTIDNNVDCDSDRGIRTLLVLDALMQTTGAVLFTWGMTSKTRRYVRNDLSLTIAPTQVSSGYGLGAFGSF